MGATAKTIALDLAAILDLLKFNKNPSGNYQDWRCINGHQAWLMSLLENNELEILESQKISINGLTSMSVKSVLNRDICWKVGIVGLDTILKDGKIYSAFKLSQGFSVFRVNYSGNEPLLVTETDKGDYLCLMMVNQAFSTIDLLKKVRNILQEEKIRCSEYTEVIIPKIELSLFTDVSFMKDLFYFQNDLRHSIKEIRQEINLNMGSKNIEIGLRTGVNLRGVSKKRLVFDRPLIGFLVSRLNMESCLPSIVFYVDFESWKKKQF